MATSVWASDMRRADTGINSLANGHKLFLQKGKEPRFPWKLGQITTGQGHFTKGEKMVRKQEITKKNMHWTIAHYDGETLLITLKSLLEVQCS